MLHALLALPSLGGGALLGPLCPACPPCGLSLPFLVPPQRERGALLRGAGARVNARDEEGWTPLHEAAGSHNIEIVRLLVEAGAKIHVKNKYGKTPLAEAIDPLNVSGKKERKEVALYLAKEMKKKKQ